MNGFPRRPRHRFDVHFLQTGPPRAGGACMGRARRRTSPIKGGAFGTDDISRPFRVGRLIRASHTSTSSSSSSRSGRGPSSTAPTLLAHGWVYPTDSSINVAIAQGAARAAARCLTRSSRRERADGLRCGTVTLGFQAGKNKTMVIDVERVPHDGRHRFRLRTNLEVYSRDSLTYASAVDLSGR